MKATAPQSVGRLWRTVRHLRVQQILGRVWFHFHRPRPDLAPAPARRDGHGPWVRPPRRAASIVGPGRWRLLGEERSIDDTGWDDPSIDRLWRYNLHYFDDLNADGSPARMAVQAAMIDRWISENPAGQGTGWEPYPTSLRAVNWIKWFMGGAPVRERAIASLAVQLRWLRARLEWHLLGNHLFANAKALLMAGLFFGGPEAEAWIVRARAILERELGEQILGDGGHFERSPMYHALALEDVLDLVNMMRASEPLQPCLEVLRVQLADKLPRMIDWLKCLSYPGGQLAHFNDCADGVAPPTVEILRYAAELGFRGAATKPTRVTHLGDSGYVRLDLDEAIALLDVAPIGPDYLPGHAHADTLSFELVVGGRAVVVNRGTSCYGTSARRQYERGTAAHSTVQIGESDSSEVWSGFRVGRRARPLDLSVTDGEIRCSHDGFRHLPSAPKHQRRWCFDDRSLQVTDSITGGVRALARFHFAPGLTLHPDRHNDWLVQSGDATIARVEVIDGLPRLARTDHADAFGCLTPAQTLEIEPYEGSVVTCWRW